MKNGLERTPSGGLKTWKNGKVILYQEPITNDPWAPQHVNKNNSNIGYRQVRHGSNRYWRVIRNKNTGKWKINENTKRTYFVSTKNGWLPEEKVYGYFRM